jgi:hypothetical protein
MVGRARLNPWLFEQADFQIGHLLEFALYRCQRRIKHLVPRFFQTSDTYRRLIRGLCEPWTPSEHAKADEKHYEYAFMRKIQKEGKFFRWGPAPKPPGFTASFQSRGYWNLG